MKYFLDTEFFEGFHKPMFGKRRHFIDLISIGIVAEDGRVLYMISKEFDLKKIWYDKDSWVKDNVLLQVFNELSNNEYKIMKYDPMYVSRSFTYRAMKALIKSYGISNKDISKQIIRFINPECIQQLVSGLWPNMGEVMLHNPDRMGNAQPEIYGYYTDYDWVLFCSLFGRMIDLPKGFPMYCRDLKQMMDEANLDGNWKAIACPTALEEHNALADAKWNKQLYEAIMNETKTK